LTTQQVVVRYRSGRTLKGITSDFKPHREAFTIEESLPGAASRPVEVRLEELKAVFFVHSLEGNRDYSERKLQLPKDKIGRPLLVTFRDGEAIRGTSVGAGLHGNGFYLFPADPRSNNKRIFVIRSAVEELREEK
jgi:small nuclear ribonucleoprotein (snRNP)-like protein